MRLEKGSGTAAGEPSQSRNHLLLWLHFRAVGFTIKANAAVELHCSMVLISIIPSPATPPASCSLLYQQYNRKKETEPLWTAGWGSPAANLALQSYLPMAVFVTPEGCDLVTCIWSRAQAICSWEISGTKGESLGAQPVPRGCQHLGRVQTLCCSCHFGLLCSQGMNKSLINPTVHAVGKTHLSRREREAQPVVYPTADLISPTDKNAGVS